MDNEASRFCGVAAQGGALRCSVNNLHQELSDRHQILVVEPEYGTRVYSSHRKLDEAQVGTIYVVKHAREGAVTANSTRKHLSKGGLDGVESEPFHVLRDVVRYALNIFLGYKWARIDKEPVARRGAQMVT
uniref:Uncharacterized protein n=1 Tax=Octactis speculum TaxID=3111310 RepID=A0A7S2DY22_9STRA|eukprot:CAMPEP_0185780652 /NCGR_PEP_ID=MMETSP1174-20130828/99798_1 /TAXON_ID=35687 /ORGANISM="Dictyocha speculum, Strain CCMP1381" /LENGTH=130 /DNA_ID=CAMNT_0028470297 /DNA_START=523 /DNA_END=915 /DNA_ORIENTATION=-